MVNILAAFIVMSKLIVRTDALRACFHIGTIAQIAVTGIIVVNPAVIDCLAALSVCVAEEAWLAFLYTFGSVPFVILSASFAGTII